jgi:hypothetical protein
MPCTCKWRELGPRGARGKPNVATFTAEMATCAMFPRLECSNNEQLPISKPHLWSSVQSSIPGATRFFSGVVGLELGPLSLVRIIEQLFQGNSGSGLENRN